jgi:hypothetical protein
MSPNKPDHQPLRSSTQPGFLGHQMNFSLFTIILFLFTVLADIPTSYDVFNKLRIEYLTVHREVHPDGRVVLGAEFFIYRRWDGPCAGMSMMWVDGCRVMMVNGRTRCTARAAVDDNGSTPWLGCDELVLAGAPVGWGGTAGGSPRRERQWLRWRVFGLEGDDLKLETTNKAGEFSANKDSVPFQSVKMEIVHAVT